MASSAVKSITKNTLALSTARIAIVIFNMAFTIFAARMLGVEGFGKYALVRGYFELFLALVSTGLSIMLTREIAKRLAWTSRYLSTALVLVTLLGIASTGILLGVGRLFGYAGDTELAMSIASLALFPAAGANLCEAAFVGTERAEFVTYGTIIENILRTGISLVALAAGYGLLSLFVILFASRVVMVLFYSAALHWRVAKLSWSFDWGFMKQLVRDWRVFAAENWLSTLFLNLGIIILSFFYTEKAVGPYAAADRVLSPLGLFAGSYTSAIFPFLSRSYVESRDLFYRITEQSVKYMLVLVLPGAILVSVFADFIVRTLYTSAYAESVPILRVLVWVLVLRFTNPFLSYTLFASGEQAKSLKVAAVSFTVYVAISVWMISQWGAVGTAWALLIAMCAALCLYFFFVFRKARMAEALWDLGRTLVAAAVTGLFAMTLHNVGVALPVLLSSTLVLYVLLLLALRVPSAGDIDMFRQVTVRAWQRFNVRMGRVIEE